MKNLIFITFAFFAPSVFSQPAITPPDMTPGHWVTTADMSSIIEQTLASMPEESRDMMRGMIEARMKDSSVTEQCITEETLNNFEQQVKEAFSNETNCELNVAESTSKKFVLTLQCPDSDIQVTTNIINDKRTETTVVTNVAGLGETAISSVSEWQSATCPANL